jgi:hypothetical protein
LSGGVDLVDCRLRADDCFGEDSSRAEVGVDDTSLLGLVDVVVCFGMVISGAFALKLKQGGRHITGLIALH